MKRRRWLSLLLFALVLIPGSAFANSLPFSYHQGGVSGAAFSVSEAPISVQKETLSFSLPDEEKLSDATICAAYDLIHKGSTQEVVSMLFPILFFEEDIKTLEESILVTVDDLPVPFQFTLLWFASGTPPRYEADAIWEREAFQKNVQYKTILQNMENQGVTLEQFVSSGIAEQYAPRKEKVFDNPMMLLVLYEVSFEPGQERHMEISYRQRGMTPSNNTEHAQDMEFYYLLNPAKGFASFGTLDISIDMKAKGTRLTAEGFDFIRGKDGVYRASFQGLPDRDLHFKLSRGNKAKEDKNWGVYYLLILIALPPLLVLAGVVVALVFIIRHFRKKNSLKKKEVYSSSGQGNNQP